MRQIYGIDMSLEKFDVNFLNSNNKPKNFIVKNNLMGITVFLEDLPKGAILCAEHTGVYGELLIFMASCMNIPLSLSTGYEIRHSLGLLKGKSDKIDAQRIREYGERFFDKLKFVKYTTEDLKELKELYSLRAQLVKERKMLLTHQKGKMHQPYSSIKAYKIVNDMFESLNKTINEIEHEINGIILANPDLRSNYKIVTSIKGIGQVTACDLIIKTGNFKEIDTAKKAASYAWQIKN